MGEKIILKDVMKEDGKPQTITEYRLTVLENSVSLFSKDLDGKFKGLYDHIDKRTRPNYQLYGIIISSLLILGIPFCAWLYSSIVSEEEFKEYQLQNMKEVNEIKVLILSEDMRKNEIERIQKPKEK